MKYILSEPVRFLFFIFKENRRSPFIMSSSFFLLIYIYYLFFCSLYIFFPFHATAGRLAAASRSNLTATLFFLYADKNYTFEIRGKFYLL